MNTSEGKNRTRMGVGKKLLRIHLLLFVTANLLYFLMGQTTFTKSHGFLLFTVFSLWPVLLLFHWFTGVAGRVLEGKNPLNN